MNSLVIVLFLSGMVAMIILRTLHKDIARYNQIDSSVSKIYTFYVSTFSANISSKLSVIFWIQSEEMRNYQEFIHANICWG